MFPLASARAATWEFAAPIAVTTASGPKLFHHLDSSGRHNIAVSGDRVTVVWEDDRDGTPRIYLAQKAMAAGSFVEDRLVSAEGEAYEPSIVGLGSGRFVVAWEEDGQVHARVIGQDAHGPIFKLAARDSVQASLTAGNGEVLLVAAERSARFSHIVLHRLKVVNERELKEAAHCAVDPEPPKDEQLYPAVTTVGGKIVVAWEDRRPGHTIIMATDNEQDTTCHFPPPRRISLRPEGRGKMPYGKGSGVARVALATHGSTDVFAVWSDKRNFREGYDIYGADWSPQGGFGSNVRVQDDFGGVASQWHASIAGLATGTLVVAWDDDRNGDPDIMLSWLTSEGWSDDTPLPGAMGAGVQSHPSITLDADGNLHAVWTERETVNGPTRLRYVIGRKVR